MVTALYERILLTRKAECFDVKLERADFTAMIHSLFVEDR